MKPYKMSVGKLINELKLIESDIQERAVSVDLRFIIDCLSDCGVKK
jgi:hypothetical protein